jgi:hypothetical protein
MERSSASACPPSNGGHREPASTPPSATDCDNTRVRAGTHPPTITANSMFFNNPESCRAILSIEKNASLEGGWASQLQGRGALRLAPRFLDHKLWCARFDARAGDHASHCAYGQSAGHEVEHS